MLLDLVVLSGDSVWPQLWLGFLEETAVLDEVYCNSELPLSAQVVYKPHTVTDSHQHQNKRKR